MHVIISRCRPGGLALSRTFCSHELCTYKVTWLWHHNLLSLLQLSPSSHYFCHIFSTGSHTCSRSKLCSQPSYRNYIKISKYNSLFKINTYYLCCSLDESSSYILVAEAMGNFSWGPYGGWRWWWQKRHLTKKLLHGAIKWSILQLGMPNPSYREVHSIENYTFLQQIIQYKYAAIHSPIN